MDERRKHSDILMANLTDRVLQELKPSTETPKDTFAKIKKPVILRKSVMDNRLRLKERPWEFGDTFEMEVAVPDKDDDDKFILQKPAGVKVDSEGRVKIDIVDDM